LDKEIEISIIEKSEFLEYSPCALPYVLSGEIKSFDDIFIFKHSDYENNGIAIKTDTKVVKIDRERKMVICKTKDREEEVFYDKLVLASGSCVKPLTIKGRKDAEYFALKTMADAKAISGKIINSGNSIVIGAGFIGLELAAALRSRNERVAVLEAKDRPLPHILDKDMGRLLSGHLSEMGIELFLGAEVKEISAGKILFNENDSLPFDDLFLCAGMKACTELAESAGLECGEAVIVNDYLETSDKDIYACGDCVLSKEMNTGKKIQAQLGTIAVKQGKIAAGNIMGKKIKANPVLNNAISKIGDLYVAAVGLGLERAKEEEIGAVSAVYSGKVRSEYHPSSSRISVKIISDLKGKIIGGQIIGHEEVAGRIDLISLAIQKGLTLGDLANLESCYNPASASINEPVSVAAGICIKKLSLANNGEA
jgi:NADH oxidase (H2O2-forming)